MPLAASPPPPAAPPPPPGEVPAAHRCARAAKERAGRMRVRGRGAPRPRSARRCPRCCRVRGLDCEEGRDRGPFCSLPTPWAWGVLWFVPCSLGLAGEAGPEARGLQCACASDARPSPARRCSVGRGAAGSAGEPRRGSVR